MQTTLAPRVDGVAIVVEAGRTRSRQSAGTEYCGSAWKFLGFVLIRDY